MRYLRYDSRDTNDVQTYPFQRNDQFELIMQNKPNLLNTQMTVSSAITMDYVNIRLRSRFKNKAKQTQFKANSNPISTQIRRKQTQSNPIFYTFFSNRRLVILTTFFISRISPLLLFLFSVRYSLKNLIRSLLVRVFLGCILSCTRFLTRSRKGSLRNFFVRSLSLKKNCRPSLFFRPSTFPSRISP